MASVASEMNVTLTFDAEDRERIEANTKATQELDKRIELLLAYLKTVQKDIENAGTL